MDKKTCNKCNEEVEIGRFYHKKDICVDCFKRMVYSNNVDVFKNALQEIELPFIAEIWDIVKDKPVESISRAYMQMLGLPRYKTIIKKGYADGTVIGEDFIDQVILNLKNEIGLLNNKIANTRNQENFGSYKNLIQAYSEILRLIERYDWQLKYSEYSTDKGKEVAVWEQNSEGSVRNHKIWNLKDKKDIYIEPDRDRLTLYYDGKIGYIKLSDSTSCKDIVDMLCNFVDISKFNIHVNTSGIGKSIGDELKNRDIVFNDARRFLLHN